MPRGRAVWLDRGLFHVPFATHDGDLWYLSDWPASPMISTGVLLIALQPARDDVVPAP